MKSLYYMVKINVVVLCFMSAFIIVSLTSAKDLGNASLIHQNKKRINSAIESTPLDLFIDKESQRRSEIAQIWKWDAWCQLQSKVGNCSNVVPRYFYDAQLDQCRTFGYSGCNGNRNNFQSLVECERHCKGTTYMSLKETSRTSYCGLQPNAGLCLALSMRYYFDVNAHHCKKFVYGGCGGNQNRFTTKEKCDTRCP